MPIKVGWISFWTVIVINFPSESVSNILLRHHSRSASKIFPEYFKLREKNLRRHIKTTRRSMKSTVFWDIAPYILLKVIRSFGETYLLQLGDRIISRAFQQISCSDYTSTPKLEAICSSETSVDFQRTTRRYIPKYSTLHKHRCEKFNSYTRCLIFVRETWISSLLRNGMSSLQEISVK
jgi:hypothetical protein